jgi:hypothetical protein
LLDYKTLEEKVGNLEGEIKNLEKSLESRDISNDDFEGKKVNLFEEIKKVQYEINQLKEELDVKSQGDKLIFDELNLLSEQFQTEIDGDSGLATIFLSASVDTHFEIDVDCSKYPEPPFLFIPKEIDDFFQGNIVSELKTLKKWSSKKPPHLVDIFKELEEKLVGFFQRDDEIVDNRERIARRRKLIQLAQKAEEAGNIEEAIDLYKGVMYISKDLKDKEAFNKYKEKIKEIETHAKQQ